MTSSLIGSFVRRQGDAAAGYWVHIEQVLPEDDTASLGEVAELVDEIWGTSPCLDESQQTTSDENRTQSEIAAPISAERLAEIVRNQFRPGLCGMNFNGDYPAQIKVAISHPGERYTLRLTNGRIGKTVTVEEALEKIIVVDSAESVDLDFPVVSGGSFTWRGSVYGQSGNMTGPPIAATGRTLAWGQPVTGSIAAAYQTRYDLVGVIVRGDVEGEPGECRAICFFHGLVDEIDIEPPDIEDDAGLEIYRQVFCGYANLQIGDPTSDEVTCYEDVTYIYRCQCSDTEAYQHTEYMVEVSCPPDIRCQAGASKCTAFMGSRTVFGGYVDCGESSGGLDDPEYRNRICCDSIGNLPKCLTTYSKNPGGVPLDPDVEAAYRRKYGNRLRIVAVSPPDGDCGVIKTTVSVSPKDCCDTVEPMAWDYNSSAEVVVPGNRVFVGVIGGMPPYHVSVRGNDFTLDGYRQRDGWTDTPYFWIYAGENACGWCSVEVADGCSVVNGGVRCTLGQWVEDLYAMPCDVAGVGEIVFGETAESISGQYKVQQLCPVNAANCYPDGALPCTEATIAAAAAVVCATWTPEQPPCFSLPAGVTDCGNGVYWEPGPDANPNHSGFRVVRAYIFNNYKLWRWVC